MAKTDCLRSLYGTLGATSRDPGAGCVMRTPAPSHGGPGAARGWLARCPRDVGRAHTHACMRACVHTPGLGWPRLCGPWVPACLLGRPLPVDAPVSVKGSDLLLRAGSSCLPAGKGWCPRGLEGSRVQGEIRTPGGAGGTVTHHREVTKPPDQARPLAESGCPAAPSLRDWGGRTEVLEVERLTALQCADWSPWAERAGRGVWALPRPSTHLQGFCPVTPHSPGPCRPRGLSEDGNMWRLQSGWRVEADARALGASWM